MRYKIGMRAWLEAVADKSLPSLVADAEGEVAAAFQGILKVYWGMELAKGKAGGSGITKVPRECGCWRGFWQEKHAGVTPRYSRRDPSASLRADWATKRRLLY